MGRFLSLILMLTIMTGMTAAGQERVKQNTVQRARVRTDKIDTHKAVKKIDGVEKVQIERTAEPMEQVIGEQRPDAPAPRLDGDVIYSQVDQMPQFPGGVDGLMEFLSSNIVYPPVAAEKNIEGRVFVQFVVEKDGSVGEIKILRSVDVNLDYEAIRLCKLMPKFEPGLLDGKPVRVWYVLPISFKLEDKV